MEILVFLFGAIIGSFLNVLIDRLPKEESIILPSSRCDRCKHTLQWYDLIPVVSFLLLRRRCRYCRVFLSWQYPLVELLTAGLFVLVFQFLGTQELIPLLYSLFIVASLIVIFFADSKYGIIPDKVVFFAIGISLLYFFTNHNPLFIPHVISGIGAFFFFLLIYLATKGRGMGFGDVKLALLLGIFFGAPAIILVIYLAFLTGAAFSIILILLRKKKLKGTIAFGPFLVASSLFVFFFQDKLVSVWYLPVAFLYLN